MSEALELQRHVDALCRTDFTSFAIRAFTVLEGGRLDVAPHINIICRFLERMTEGEFRRGLVCMPPRYLKTYLISIAYTAWLLGKDPRTRIICASYGALLSEKFSADTLRLMQSPWYKRVFPRTYLSPKQQSKTEIATTVGGYRLATSVGGTVTGRGADLLIIDDPLKASEAHSPTAREGTIHWFNSTIHSRFDQPKKGRVIVVAQRLHAEDLPGHLISVGGWEELILPAINPKDAVFEILAGGAKAKFRAGRILQSSRHDEADLAQLKREMGSHDFEAQFNQCPLPPGGSVFQNVWVPRYDDPPHPSTVEAVIQSWDTAYEGDEGNSYTVCTTWAKCPDGYYLLDVWRDRPAFPTLIKQVLALKAKWKASLVIVENKASGISLIEVLNERERQPWLMWLGPEKGKVERAHQQAVKVEQGKLWLPKSAPWLAAYEAELFAFPQAKYDDQVDSTTQFLAALDYPLLHQRLRSLR